MTGLEARVWTELALAVGAASALAATATLTLARWRGFCSMRRQLRVACHELRGPLTAVALGVELAERSGGLTPERFRAIELELGRAALALDDLEELSAGNPAWCAQTLERVEIGPLLTASVEAWRPAASTRELRLTLPAGFGALVAGSRLRIAQATDNLIANSIEHGRGRIDVVARVVGATVRVEVLDGGDGLTRGVARQVGCARRSLVRLRSGARRSARGSTRGHGLAIASGVAAAHGGRLFSAPSGGGARVVLELPLARPRPAQERRAAGAQNRGGRV
jgi:signal transduction histidine kinase